MLVIYKPKVEDLWFKQMMMSDEETMSYNHAYGGVIPFPKERWKEWFDRWVGCTDKKRFYRYLKDEKDSFIGEISYHYDESVNGYMCDVIVYSKCRGKGYGSQALDMLCRIAKENGIPELWDEIANDNPSIHLFLKKEFKEISHNEETTILKKIL